MWGPITHADIEVLPLALYNLYLLGKEGEWWSNMTSITSTWSVKANLFKAYNQETYVLNPMGPQQTWGFVDHC